MYALIEIMSDADNSYVMLDRGWGVGGLVAATVRVAHHLQVIDELQVLPILSTERQMQAAEEQAGYEQRYTTQHKSNVIVLH